MEKRRIKLGFLLSEEGSVERLRVRCGPVLIQMILLPGAAAYQHVNDNDCYSGVDDRSGEVILINFFLLFFMIIKLYAR